MRDRGGSGGPPPQPVDRHRDATASRNPESSFEMQDIVEFVTGLGGWLWFILALVLVLLESVLPGIHFIWFGLAAIVVGTIALSIDIDWQVQVLAFAILSVASAFIVRRYFAPQNTPTDQPTLNERGSNYIGRIVVVADPIVNGRGRVRVGDSVWTASGPDMTAGARARVTSVDGTVLVVEPADADLTAA
jgi:membrane protein implicated in regulation of membrane protease activity